MEDCLPPENVQACCSNVDWHEVLKDLASGLMPAVHLLGDGTVGLGSSLEGIAIEGEA